MITNTNNGAGRGRQNYHLSSSSSLLDIISPYRVVYYQSAGADEQTTHNGKADYTFPIVLGAIAIVLFLLRCIYYDCHRNDDVEQPADQTTAGGGDHSAVQPPPPPPSSTAVEMSPVAVPAAEPPLSVCTTYRKADGCGEASSCGVCLTDLADGEALRVLPACMHYFHTVCVNEWLRRHATCPLCRATLVAPANNT